MVRLEQYQWMVQAVCALAQRIHPAPHGCHPLADVEVEALNNGCIDLPTTHRQDLLDGLTCAEHHPVFDPNETLPSYRLHHLDFPHSIELRGGRAKGKPETLGLGASLVQFQ
jgi:hypothetical protein